MKRIPITEAREQFGPLIDEVKFTQEPFVIEKNKKEYAAVVPVFVLDLLAEIERIVDVEDALETLKQAETEGFTTLKDLKADLDL